MRNQVKQHADWILLHAFCSIWPLHNKALNGVICCRVINNNLCMIEHANTLNGQLGEIMVCLIKKRRMKAFWVFFFSFSFDFFCFCFRWLTVTRLHTLLVYNIPNMYNPVLNYIYLIILFCISWIQNVFKMTRYM